MKTQRWSAILTLVLITASLVVLGCQIGTLAGTPAAASVPRLPGPDADDPSPPAAPVKLVFVHHSTGGNWLADPAAGNDLGGDLGRALRDNNYFASATNYGWGPDAIGDNTDIGHWWLWFRGPDSATYTAALYSENGQNFGDYGSWPRLASEPAGENQVILFKSCFPNSNLPGSPGDPVPPIDSNPLRGQDAYSEHHTVANAKGIYIDLLEYFRTRQDKLFIVITAPPVQDGTWAANARAFNDWLVNDWLDSYPYSNVAVYDFYNVLTSNGGTTLTNDLGWEAGNHHRWWNGAVQHQQTVANNTSAYPTAADDDHPNHAGNLKASGEFVQMLNVFYHRWAGGVAPTATSGTPPTTTPNVPPTATPTAGPVTAQGYLPLTSKSWPPVSPSPTPGPTAAPSPGPTATPSPGGLDVTLTVNNASAAAYGDEPVTSGVPLPRSLNLTSLANLRLLDNAGQPVPAQFTPLARWGGAPGDTTKPVRWLLLDFQADVPASSSATYRLVDSGGALPAYPTLDVTDGAGAVTVNTGAAQFSISKSDGLLNGPNLSAPLFGQATDANGIVYTTAGPVTVAVAMDGAMRAVVEVRGSYRNGATVLLDYTTRLWFYAGQSTVRLFHTVENNTLCPLDEYSQLLCYDIGSSGSITVADLSLVLPASLGEGLTYQAAGQGTPVSGNLTADLLLYQDSSGTDYWDHYPTMRDWEDNPLDTRPRMQSYVSFRGYRTTLGAATVDSGDHAAGWLRLSGGSGSWTVGVRDFWQNFPKALRAGTSGAIEVGLFPGEFGPAGYGFNLRAGEHKTHEVILSPGSLDPLPPLMAQAPAQWYVDSGALGLTAVRDWSDWPDHEHYIDYQLDTSPDYDAGSMDWFPNLPTAIASTDFYGLWDYGDWPIDYEGYHVAPLNAKYDDNLGVWLQWVRTGDARWRELAEAGNRHLADVDILHNLHSPRHWGDGIAFGHSYHDEDGFLNPHRNYGGNHPDVAFGTAGLLLTYYLTGYEKAYDAALELADCIEYRLHNDANLCSYFADCSGEGYGLGDSGGLFQDSERPAANGLNIAVSAYRATADSRYLAVADALVDWARASAQPYIGGPTGEDMMMKPQMLNLYLRSLADYLELRGEFGLPDSYGAAQSFLAYADWLHTYAWIDLSPIDTGARAAYPYEWWFDGRAENDVPEVCNWQLLGADAMAYAHHLSDNASYLEWAARLFRAGSRDPWFEGDANTYSDTKGTVNSISFGHMFLYEWGR